MTQASSLVCVVVGASLFLTIMRGPVPPAIWVALVLLLHASRAMPASGLASIWLALYDADFPDFIRQASRGAADLLILPVNDWSTIKATHLQMHAFRAIENGVPLVRAASSGLSAATYPWGRVLGLADFFATGDGTMTAQVPVGRVPTLYSRIGDLFAWICIAGLVIVLGAPR